VTFRRRVAGSIGIALAMLLIAGCGEKPQTMDASAKKRDAPPWSASDAAEPAFAASGWKGGDKAAWEAQMRARNQAQNDFAR
jgi:hypothetical protein